MYQHADDIFDNRENVYWLQGDGFWCNPYLYDGGCHRSSRKGGTGMGCVTSWPSARVAVTRGRLKRSSLHTTLNRSSQIALYGPARSRVEV